MAAPLKTIHTPIMTKRIVTEASSCGNGLFVDCTMGDGGHSFEIYKHVIQGNRNSFLLSIDWDKENYEFVKQYYGDQDYIKKHKEGYISQNWMYYQTNFIHIEKAVTEMLSNNDKNLTVKYILFDLGVSSRQLANKERGFSFSGRGILDMRMDKETYNVTAYELLNVLSVAKLTDMFIKTVGIKKQVARKMAQEIVHARERKRFGSIDDISRINAITSKIVPIRTKAIGRLHPSTLVFLALRIAVNTELRNLFEVLPIALSVLCEGGKLLLISFHSSEEKIIRNFIDVNHLKMKLYMPSAIEVKKNPRARSSKLFVITK